MRTLPSRSIASTCHSYGTSRSSTPLGGGATLSPVVSVCHTTAVPHGALNLLAAALALGALGIVAHRARRRQECTESRTNGQFGWISTVLVKRPFLRFPA